MAEHAEARTVAQLSEHVAKCVKMREVGGAPFAERNNLPAVVEVRRTGKRGRSLRSHFYPVTYMWTGEQGVNGRRFGLTVIVDESERIR